MLILVEPLPCVISWFSSRRPAGTVANPTTLYPTIEVPKANQAAVTAKAPGPIPRHQQEDFCVGHDDGQPFATYSQGKPFTGTISDRSITVSSK